MEMTSRDPGDARYWNSLFDKEGRKFYLASQSERRKWILQTWGLHFEVLTSKFDEESFLEDLTSITKKDGIWEVHEKEHKFFIHEICKNLAVHKGLAVWEELRKKSAEHGDAKFFILTADTIVYYNQFFFTKPKNKDEAFTVLKFLSAKTHTVLTSHCLIDEHKLIKTKEIMTLVTFRKLSDEEILSYIQTDEPYDKAGGYAVQGGASIFIDSIVGDYLNVIGLSIQAVRQLIQETVT